MITTCMGIERSPRALVSAMALVELGRFAQSEAHILVGRLAADGIAAIAFDSGSSIADGSWLLIPVRVMVDEDDLAAAQAIVHAA